MPFRRFVHLPLVAALFASASFATPALAAGGSSSTSSSEGRARRPAEAKPAKRPKTASRTADRRPAPSVSIGSPTDGRLVSGVRISESPSLRMFPTYEGTDVRYGLGSLVAMLEHAARTVRKQFPGAVLTMGQLSKAGGGQVDRHASHESGRDADVGFYVKSTTGKSIYAEHMVVFGSDGRAPSWPGAVFDDAKNWALVAAMLSDTRVRITHIFVATHLRSRLLAYAAKVGAPESLRRRASEVLAQPRGSLPHDDHFHVRIACPSQMSQCVEWPMRKRTLGTAKRKVSGKGQATDKRTERSTRGESRRSPAHDEPRERVEDRQEDRTRAESDSSIPSLAPSVPGLDSVVIPAWLGGSEKKVESRPLPSSPPVADGPLVDDPDGVLDGYEASPSDAPSERRR